MTKKMKIPFSPPDITELEANEVRDALLSGWITTGPRTKEFEWQIARMCNLVTDSEALHPNVVCLNSATAAMEMFYRLLDLKAGDEVIVPAYTYTATASSVVHAGGRLVMVDSAPGTFEMDYEKLAQAITPRTKAIAGVDIAGMVCDYQKIFDIVNRPEIKSMFTAESELQSKFGRVIVLADCAHAFGSKRRFDGKWKMAGEIADFSAFSFHAVKNFTTAEGGALTWQSLGGEYDIKLYNQLQLLSLHGQSKDALAKSKLGAWEYDVVGTYYKANMTDIMAAIGIAQMKRYPDMLAKREKTIKYYNERLQKFIDDGRIQVLNNFTEDSHSNGHLYILRLTGKDESYRNEIITRMAELGVSTNVHFKPLPMMTAYKNLGFDIKDYPNAFAYYKNEITLPLYSRLTDEEKVYVMDCFVDVLK